MPRCNLKSLMLVEMCCIVLYFFTWNTHIEKQKYRQRLSLLRHLNSNDDSANTNGQDVTLSSISKNQSGPKHETTLYPIHDVTDKHWNGDYTTLWNMLDSFISNASMYPADFDTDIAVNALKHAKVVEADIFPVRTSLKWVMKLEGGQTVLFKPSLMPKFTSFSQCNAGCEQPESEVAGFLINKMLGIRNFPYTSGRKINWFTELNDVATDRLKEQIIINEDGDVCFLPITCLRVPKPVVKCFRGGIIEGAMIYFFRKTVKSVTDNGREFHPYYPRPRYYEQPKVEFLRMPSNDSYCKTFRQLDIYKESSMFEYILDFTILSFITNHRDQKVAIVHNETTRLPIIIDFGLSFCTPDDFDIILAAPLYQCCNVRRSTYERLLTLRDTFLSEFEDVSKKDPLYPLLPTHQLKDIVRRIKIILALLEFCTNIKGYNNVVKDTFVNV